MWGDDYFEDDEPTENAGFSDDSQVGDTVWRIFLAFLAIALIALTFGG